MNGKLELFVEGQKVDLFDFEDMSISDKIRDVRDISKVFTAYSKEFVIPASPRNSKIFKHFYNIDISNGFDSRIKVDAEVKIGGVTYKEGKLTLTKSSLKEDMPYSYSVIFYGKTVALPQILGDLELSDLTDTLLDDFTVTYSSNYVKDGITDGYTYNETTGVVTTGGDDLVFPFISGESFYFYDSEPLGLSPKDIVDSRNVCPTANPDPEFNKGLYYADLKASLKVKWIVKAIEQKFGFTFSNEFFRDSNKVYNDLHMWLSREKGNIFSQIEKTSETFELDSPLLVFNSGTDYRNAFGTQSEVGFAKYPQAAGSSNVEALANVVKFRVNTVGDGNWSVTVRDKNQSGEPVIAFFTGNESLSSQEVELYLVPLNAGELPLYEEYTLQPEIEISTQGGITEYSITDFQLCDVITNGRGDTTIETRGCGSFTYNGGSSTALSNGFDLISQFPKIKIIDFLTSMFKMFNLTAYYVPELEVSDYAGQIRVRTLDNFFLSGSTFDLTRSVDTKKIDVSRNNLFSEINFEFEKPSTFAVVNANQFRPTYDEFGVERINNVYSAFIDNPLAFDGGKYDVKPKFEKMLYERMSDQENEAIITSVLWGWSATENEQPKITKPILHYPISQSTIISKDDNGDDVKIQLDLSTYDREGTNVAASYETIEQYFRPSNSLDDYSATVNFGDEYDEWGVYTNEGGQDNSLFYIFYRKYILAIYNKQSRLIKLKAYLNTGTLLNLKLNDVIIIKSRRYRINEIKNINLSTGLADLELMNDIAYSLNDLGALIIARIADSETEGTFSILDDNYSITQNIYDIYLDDVKILANQSLGTSFTLNKTTYPQLDTSALYIKSILEDGQEMKSNVLTPLVQGITTELDEPIITEDGIDNLIVENDLYGAWSPLTQTYSSEGQTGTSTYNGLDSATIEIKELGFASDWITITSPTTVYSSPYVLTFELSQNTTGADRKVGVRADDGADRPVFVITQAEGGVTFDSISIKLDNDITTWDTI